jgi:hypothetical protein
LWRIIGIESNPFTRTFHAVLVPESQFARIKKTKIISEKWDDEEARWGTGGRMTFGAFNEGTIRIQIDPDVEFRVGDVLRMRLDLVSHTSRGIRTTP